MQTVRRTPHIWGIVILWSQMSTQLEDQTDVLIWAVCCYRGKSWTEELLEPSEMNLTAISSQNVTTWLLSLWTLHSNPGLSPETTLLWVHMYVMFSSSKFNQWRWKMTFWHLLGEWRTNELSVMIHKGQKSSCCSSTVLLRNKILCGTNMTRWTHWGPRWGTGPSVTHVSTQSVVKPIHLTQADPDCYKFLIVGVQH